MLPGLQLMDGRVLCVREGHTPEPFCRFNPNLPRIPGHNDASDHPVTCDCANELFDQNQIFLSPSPLYASHEKHYSDWHVCIQSDGHAWRVRCMLEVRVSPDCFTVGPQTIGATSPIDPDFDNDELEWYTKSVHGVILTGLLIQVERL